MKPKVNQQILILDEPGYILSSNDTIFSTAHLKDTPVFTWSPFLESIYPVLMNHRNSEVITFEKVKTIHNFLPGIYDYSFLYCAENQSPSIIWKITDLSEMYKDLLNEQQLHHSQILKETSLTFE